LGRPVVQRDIQELALGAAGRLEERDHDGRPARQGTARERSVGPFLGVGRFDDMERAGGVDISETGRSTRRIVGVKHVDERAGAWGEAQR
jgi:hypothetical protein